MHVPPTSSAVRDTAEPSVTVNGFEGGSPRLQKTVLPVEAEANVSIRLAPGQSTAAIAPVFEQMLREAAPEGATIDVELWSTGEPGYVDPASPAVRLAQDAFEHVLGTRPLLTRSGRLDPRRRRARRARHPDDRHRLRAPEAQTSTRRTRTSPRPRSGKGSRPRSRSCDGSRPLADPRYSTALAEELAEDVLERFLRYVVVDTQADPDSTTYPSTAKQLDLCRLLVEELREIGLEDVELTEPGYVFATVPGTVDDAPTVGLIAHVDTSPAAPGSGVVPIVHRRWTGEPIRLPGERGAGARPGRDAGARGQGRPRHRHERRDDAARRRRQGGRGRSSSLPPPGSYPTTRRERPRASRSPSTKRSARAPTTSISTRSAPTSPTRSTARASARSRARRSPPTRSWSGSKASASTPGPRRAGSSARSSSWPTSSRRCRATGSHPRRPRGARDSSTRNASPGRPRGRRPG